MGDGILGLCNRADGVNGHYCIGRWSTTGGHQEYWNEQSKAFTSAGTVYVGVQAAEDALNKLEMSFAVEDLIDSVSAAFILMNQFAKDPYNMGAKHNLRASVDANMILAEVYGILAPAQQEILKLKGK